MDDFTFPTTASPSSAADTTTTASAAPSAEPLRLHHHHRRLLLHFAASPLWFPSSCPVAAAPPESDVAASAKVVVVDSVPAIMTDREDDDEEQQPGEGNSKMAATSELLPDGDGSGDEEGEEEKMDMLWEDFNEELQQQQVVQRVGSCPREASAEAGMDQVCSPAETASDAESEPAVMMRRGGGCAPAMMLRATSRAGGTGHYRQTTSWALLMKIFRRLFVIEKTISASARHGRPPPRR